MDDGSSSLWLHVSLSSNLALCDGQLGFNLKDQDGSCDTCSENFRCAEILFRCMCFPLSVLHPVSPFSALLLCFLFSSSSFLWGRPGRGPPAFLSLLLACPARWRCHCKSTAAVHSLLSPAEFQISQISPTEEKSNNKKPRVNAPKHFCRQKSQDASVEKSSPAKTQKFKLWIWLISCSAKKNQESMHRKKISEQKS